jgi:hypothetical protein
MSTETKAVLAMVAFISTWLGWMVWGVVAPILDKLQ